MQLLADGGRGSPGGRPAPAEGQAHIGGQFGNHSPVNRKEAWQTEDEEYFRCRSIRLDFSWGENPCPVQ